MYRDKITEEIWKIKVETIDTDDLTKKLRLFADYINKSI